jgi:hypothetical protein
MRLVNEHGRPVLPGETIYDFRGDSHIFEGGIKPKHSGSTGRVCTDQGEFYPSVFNMKWEQE